MKSEFAKIAIGTGPPSKIEFLTESTFEVYAVRDHGEGVKLSDTKSRG